MGTLEMLPEREHHLLFPLPSLLRYSHPAFQAIRLLLSGPRLPGYERPLWVCWPAAPSLALTTASSISSPGEGWGGLGKAAAVGTLQPLAPWGNLV